MKEILQLNLRRETNKWINRRGAKAEKVYLRKKFFIVKTECLKEISAFLLWFESIL